MPVALKVTDTIDQQLAAIARMAYQHGSKSEKGWGRLGKIGDHVVKFNTHYRERHTSVDTREREQMETSCQNLRIHLYAVLKKAYGEEMSPAVKKAMTKLGITQKNGKIVYEKSLLKRSLVAALLNTVKADINNNKTKIGGACGQFMAASGDATQPSTKWKDATKDIPNVGTSTDTVGPLETSLRPPKEAVLKLVPADKRRIAAERGIFLQVAKAYQIEGEIPSPQFLNKPVLAHYVYSKLESQISQGALPSILDCIRAIRNPDEEKFSLDFEKYLLNRLGVSPKDESNEANAAANAEAKAEAKDKANAEAEAEAKDKANAEAKAFQKLVPEIVGYYRKNRTEKVPTEKPKSDDKNNTWTKFQKFGDADKVGKVWETCIHSVISFCSCLNGGSRIEKLRDSLKKALMGAFVPVELANFTKKEETLIEDVAKEILPDGADTFANEDSLVRELTEKFNFLNLRKGLSLTNEQARQVLWYALSDYMRPSSYDINLIGGTFVEPESYSFKAKVGGANGIEEKELTSNFNPAPPREPLEKETDTCTYPIVNLGLSSLKNGDEALVSFVRFGQANAPGRNETEEVARERAVHHYTEIAKLILENASEDLRTQAQTSSEGNPLKLPIYRVDMSSGADPRLPMLDKTTVLTFKIGDQTVYVTPEIHCVHAPTDSSDPVCAIANSKTQTIDALGALLEEAKSTLKDEKLAHPRKAKIQKLYDSLKGECEKARSEEGKNQIVGAFQNYKSSHWLRLGSQVAMLASLLGHTPAINCNMGRDRTGAMDNEIKFLACKLTREDAKISVNEDSEGDVEERTRFLNKTGNNAIAHRMNGKGHPINLNQDGSDLHKCYSGLSKGKYLPLEDEVEGEG